MDHTIMSVDSTGLTDTMADREWPPCLASGTIGSSEAAPRYAYDAYAYAYAC